ncbi:MAG TPA: methyl-accepting chemotaxis protein [Bryobacteraceae bacterium]|nr:methyl-accepting chemotaxis protein [Bryobacteraceae bacterium]
MKRLNITAKIWLSIGFFVLGYVVSIVLGQLQGVATERALRTTSQALFPAAQDTQEAEAAFQRMVKGFGDAVITQDASGLERATEDGRHMVRTLRAVAAISGIPPERSAEAAKLAASGEQLAADARSLYGSVLANPANMNAQAQEKMRSLASRTDELKAQLAKAKETFSRDLQDQLNGVGRRSETQRGLALVVFGVTLLVAAVVVSFTIRRSITGPVLRVIDGVQNAADGASRASGQMLECGQAVQNDATEQAACIEETSASLEEISSTARQNANRASEADNLMQEARKTVTHAAEAMNDLTASMDLISKSSNQVAGVLKSIDEIAFHTNILALNAAVEAARAGEAGAGFSVVAGEVRSLAQRAAEAARNSAEIVERTIGDINKGVGLVSQAHRAFQEVSDKISSGGQMVSQIAASSQEQARGVGHVSQAISRIETVTQNNAANAHRTAEVASAMSDQVLATRRHLAELVNLVGLRRAHRGQVQEA